MKINILVIDTDYTRVLLRKKLEEQNHNVIAETKSYKEALELYTTYLPDIVIVDIDLETTEKGINFIQELLKIDSSTQVIALSNFFENKTKAKLYRLGIERLVMKPYQPAHIWSQIDDICKVNDILLMRKYRESTLDSFEQVTKGDLLNNQIISLREQISQKRNKVSTVSSKNSSKDTYLDFSENPIYLECSYDNADDFQLDFDDSRTLIVDDKQDINLIFEQNPPIKFNQNKYKFIEEESNVDFDKTEISNNCNQTNISLKDTYPLNSANNSIEQDSPKGYLNLPIYINRDKNAQDLNSETEYIDECDNSADDRNATFFNRILKIKKGDK